MNELYATADSPNPPAFVNRLGIFTALYFVAAQVYAFVTSPPVPNGMGHLQKIMYVHVPAAWAGMIAFLVVFVVSIMFLIRKRSGYDLYAAAAVEVGVIMTALALVLGSIWGRPTWGKWWAWDPRMTTTAVMLLIYVGYLALRGFTEDEEQRARWSAAIGVIAFLNVPIVWYSVQWWVSLHQPQSTRESMSDVYWTGLLLNAVAFLLLFVYLSLNRYYVARIERAVELRHEEAALGAGRQHV